MEQRLRVPLYDDVTYVYDDVTYVYDDVTCRFGAVEQRLRVPLYTAKETCK